MKKGCAAPRFVLGRHSRESGESRFIARSESAWIPACAGMTETAARRFFCRECDTDIFQGVHEATNFGKRNSFFFFSFVIVVPVVSSFEKYFGMTTRGRLRF
jgi:hypothetical protein